MPPCSHQEVHFGILLRQLSEKEAESQSAARIKRLRSAVNGSCYFNRYLSKFHDRIFVRDKFDAEFWNFNFHILTRKKHRLEVIDLKL